MPGAVRTLSPLPLFDEPSLLRACAESSPPITAASQHATAIWKALLRAELDSYHPGYLERLQSRLASRHASRAASRIGSRRPSVGGAERENVAASAAANSIAEEETEVEEKAVAQQQQHHTERKREDNADEESKDGDSSNCAASDSPSASHESEAARHAAERAARLKLEAEDDARSELSGQSCFPRSRYNPSAADLADPNHPVHDQRTVTPDFLPGLPARMYPMLASRFAFLTTRLVSHKTSADGSTTKMLLRLQDGQHIESVIMRHKAGDPETGRVEQRITLCVSSQVGCAMGCTFCATGTMGMLANLTAGEILEQLIWANRFERIRNVVYMGMGEPLKNYECVKAAISAMTDANRFGLAPSRITLSTVGVIPKMLELTRDIPNIQLALSLHAPTQELRQTIVPTARSYPLDKLIEAVDYFIQRSGKRILIEYVLLDGVNASPKEAHELGQLLRGKAVMINLIPYNSTSVAAHYRAPSRADSDAFQSILLREYGLFTTTRVEMGADIEGACGQLALENQNIGLAVKPRGLAHEGDTVPSEEMRLPSSAGAGAGGGSGCLSAATSGDIEDMAPVSRGKKLAAAIIRKRRGGGGEVAIGDGASASPIAASSSPVAVAASASSCCSDADAICDCEKSRVHASSGAAASASPTTGAVASPALDSDEDDERTVGEILEREGVKLHTAEELLAAATHAASTTEPEHLPPPPDAQMARAQLELSQCMAARDRAGIAIVAGFFLMLAVVLHVSGGRLFPALF